MKFALFFLTLSTLLEAYHGRHLHDTSIYKSFDQRPTFQEVKVIQMVTSKKDQTTYGQVNVKAPPSPRGAPSQGQTTYGRDNPKSPPSPSLSPSQGQTTYGGNNPNSKGLQDFLTLLPEAIRRPPPSAPSQGQTTYGADNTNSNSDTTSFTYTVKIVLNEDRWPSISSYLLPSYVIRVFNMWG